MSRAINRQSYKNKNFMTREEIQAKIKYEAEKNGLEAEILDKLIFSESSYNQYAVGKQTKYGKARGIAQFLPWTGKKYGVNDLYDLNQSIEGAAKYLSDLKAQNGGDIWLALADYKGYVSDKAGGSRQIKLLFSRLESKGYIPIGKNISTAGVKKNTSGGINGAILGAASDDSGGSSLFLKIILGGMGVGFVFMGFWLLANPKNLKVVKDVIM